MDKINLNNVSGTYANCLSEKLQDIYALYGDNSIDVNAFKDKIREIVSSAKDTEAKRLFLMRLSSQRTKDNVVMYISNITLRADHMSANVDDKWGSK